MKQSKSVAPPLELGRKVPTGKHAGKLLKDALLDDPAYWAMLVDNGFRNFADEVWEAMDLVGTLDEV